MREIKFRGKRVDTGEWVYGDITGGNTIHIQPPMVDGNGNYEWWGYEVTPETVGQLRHEKDGIEYYDGDVYYHAGYGLENVSDICELQFALYSGNCDDIGNIIGNIHDYPELLKDGTT